MNLSTNQLQFWILDQISNHTSAYNIPSAILLKGELKIEILQRSLNEVVKRHDVFRAHILLKNNNPFQIIADNIEIPFDIIDISTLKESSKPDVLNDYIIKEINKNFNLENGPLIRFKLLKISEIEHVLIITIHHIIIDLNSKDQFSAELSALYNSYSLNQPLNITEQVNQYSDYINWQSEWMHSEQYCKMKSFWRKELEGKKFFLDFPIDNHHPPIQSYKGKEYYFEFSKTMSIQLEEFSKRHVVDIFVVLLSAYFALLYKYSRQSDIILGIPFTNRRQPVAKDTIGCFMNILPVVAKLNDDITFDNLLKQVRKFLLLAHRNQELPFSDIIETLELEKNSRYNPLFQYGFTFEHPMNLEFAGIQANPIKTYLAESQLDLFITLWHDGEKYNARFTYKTALFNDETIIRLASNYLTLLNSILEQSDGAVSGFNFISESEQNKLLFEFNNTNTNYSKTKSVYNLFEEQVGKYPESIAVICDNDKLTYFELNQKVSVLSVYLISIGAGAGTLVGIFIERSIDMLICLLAVLKSGGAYVPLDPIFPVERLAFMIETTELSVIFTQSLIAYKLLQIDIKKIQIDTDWVVIEQASEKYLTKHGELSLGHSVSADDTAYVIFTSGSTGKPKGVEVKHAGLTNFLCSMAESPGFCEKDYLAALTTICFDIAALELFLPIIRGGKVEILKEEVVRDGFLLKEKLQNPEITVIQATPATWKFLVDVNWQPENKLKILCGGEALTKELANKLLDKKCELWNMYGPTETTIWSSISKLSSSDLIDIGTPIANTQFYILDDKMKIVPIGVIGELYIGGDGVANGYFNRPDLTEERFFQNLFINDQTSRIYKTGDLAKLLPDGKVICMGRSDRQIKLRGFRIEPDEIENALNEFEVINNSAVIFKKNGSGENFIAAFIVLNKIQLQAAEMNKNIIEDIKYYLATKLPDYMIPASFTLLENLPFTLNGKIDRKILEAYQLDTHLNNTRTVAVPQNETESKLLKLWKKKLNNNNIGINDNLFDAGGNSLLAIQLQIDIFENFNKKFPIVKIFEYPTIKKFSEFLLSENTSSNANLNLDLRADKRLSAIKRRKEYIFDKN